MRTIFTWVLWSGLAWGDARQEQAEYRAFIASHPGDAEAGGSLFRAMGCMTCHSVDGSGGKAGPDLANIGDKFQRSDLATAVLEPSDSIAIGYATTVITRTDGSVVAGVIKQATAASLELKIAGDLPPVRVAMADIDKQETSAISLMPEGLHNLTDASGFADLIAYLAGLKMAVTATDAESIPRASVPLVCETFFDEAIQFEEPTWFGEIPGVPGIYLVLEHRGRIWRVKKQAGGDEKKLFLDLRDQVRAGGATGLLSLAFHPDFPAKALYYLKYQIVEKGAISTLLVERTFAPDFSADSGEPAREVMKIGAATQDHNGGCIAFGPDGFLYLGMGDTGPQGDPQGHGQDRGVLWGKILRIDINRRDANRSYAIPEDNPFVKTDGTLPEIWALGFREPWRFSWDAVTGDMWLGDVGQNNYEEVTIVRKGENHGWNVMEGFTPFSQKYRHSEVTLVPPVWSYSHRLGVSVTGGYVYWGKRSAALEGGYIFADHESRRIWALRQEDRKMKQVVEIGRAPARAVSFSQTKDGELYLTGFTSGKIYHLALDQVDLTPPRVEVIAPTAERNPVEWNYSLDQPARGWMTTAFDDSKWQRGQGGFGTAETPGARVGTTWNTNDIWLRRNFDLPSFGPVADAHLVLRIHHDEDAEVYLNGTRVAVLDHWSQAYGDVPLTPEAAALLGAGINVLAIHCHQQGGGQYIDAGLVQSGGR